MVYLRRGPDEIRSQQRGTGRVRVYGLLVSGSQKRKNVMSGRLNKVAKSNDSRADFQAMRLFAEAQWIPSSCK